MEPLFSVIIPHRDIPDLLIRCLDSIPIRKEIQVIVVDDNSLGADSYLEKYPELSRPYLEFYCTTKVGGAGYARNIGLEHAKGKWLLFADADDFFVNDVYDIIISHIESEADVIYFKRKAVFSDDIGAVKDMHVLIGENKDRQSKRVNAERDEWSWSETLAFYNSGVMHVKDSPLAHSFYQTWHNKWVDSVGKTGDYKDQSLLAATNELFQYPIKELPGEWNCQIYRNGI